jgi:ABC-type sugar transport system substrate-binding protein
MKKQLNARKNWLLPVAGTLALAGMVMADKVGSPIPIGFSVAQTSNTALLGKEQVIGAQIAEEFFNGRGGINGTPFKLFFEDTGGDEAGAINAFQTQINKNKVVGIVGPTLSQQAFAADKIAEQAKVPVLGPSNTAKGIPEIGDFIARVSAPVAIVAPNSVKAALKLNPAAKKAAVMFAQNDAFSTSETGTFQETAKAQGLEITTVQKFQTTDTDFTTQVTAALATSPDIIIVSGLAADGGRLQRHPDRWQRFEHRQHVPRLPAVLRRCLDRASVQPHREWRFERSLPHGLQEQVQKRATTVHRASVRRRASHGRSLACRGQESQSQRHRTGRRAHRFERANLEGQVQHAVGRDQLHEHW